MIRINKLFKPSSKSLVVMGKRRLNATDSLIPLLLELAVKYELKIIFCVEEYYVTYRSIRNNAIINDIINNNGTLVLLGGRSKFLIVRYMNWLFHVFFISLHGLAKGRIFHYGTLNTFPFTLLRMFFSSRIFLIENNTNETDYRTSVLKYKSSYSDKKITRREGGYLFDKDCKDPRIIYRSSTIKNYIPNNDYDFYYYGRSRSRPLWIDYISNNADKYFEKYHPTINKSSFIVIVGTIYNDTADHLDLRGAFLKTLDSIQRNYKDQIFLFKPHPLTDIDFVINEFDKRNIRLEITKLHSHILATRAIAFVANGFSNVLTDAHLLGIPTVEFSIYSSKLLKITNNTSVSENFVDYFIHNNSDKFIQIMNNLIYNSTPAVVNFQKNKIEVPSADKVLKDIAY